MYTSSFSSLVHEKFIILYTCLFGSERTPKLILNLQVSLMHLVPTICLFWGGINITVLGICNVAPNFSQVSLYQMQNCTCSFKSIFPTCCYHGNEPQYHLFSSETGTGKSQC